MITPIENLTAISSVKKAGSGTETSAVKTGEGSVFASIFQNAIQNVKETDAAVVEAQYLLSTGQLDNPASAMIAITKESTAVNLLIQLRNRALDAYQELTRLSI